MGFPDNVLTPGEKVVKQLHPHWRSVAVASLLGVLLIAACIWVVIATPNDSTGNVIQWIAIGVAVLLGIPMVIVPLLAWRTTHYVITTHRVMVRRGILRKSGKDITLSKVTDVSFSQSLIDRMVGSGTLNVESAGDSPDEAFRDIPHSDQVQQLLNRLIDEDANKRAFRIAERAGYPLPEHGSSPPVAPRQAAAESVEPAPNAAATSGTTTSASAATGTSTSAAPATKPATNPPPPPPPGSPDPEASGPSTTSEGTPS